jgi:hypothetical protein
MNMSHGSFRHVYVIPETLDGADLIEAVLRDIGELAAPVTPDDKIFGHK